jgi:hypothetical protein
MATKNGAKAGAWSFNFNAIKRKEKTDFLAMLNRAIAESNDDLLLPYMTRVIEAWPLSGDPSKIEDYAELGFEEWTEVVARFMECFPTIESTQRRLGNGGGAHGAGDSAGRAEGTDA